jgi:protein-tyrosine phosphatase
MHKVFWLIPSKLAGRPGPDREPWDAEALHAGGIRAVLSVNDGRSVYPEDFSALEMVYAHIPLSDSAPPRQGDDEICQVALPRAYMFMHEQIGAGNPVLVHCSSGKDRTGLVLAYYLLRETDCSPASAIEKVRAVRPIALSAMGWDRFAFELLSMA